MSAKKRTLLRANTFTLIPTRASMDEIETQMASSAM